MVKYCFFKNSNNISQIREIFIAKILTLEKEKVRKRENTQMKTLFLAAFFPSCLFFFAKPDTTETTPVDMTTFFCFLLADFNFLAPLSFLFLG